MLSLSLPRRKIGTDYLYGRDRFRYKGKNIWQPWKVQEDLLQTPLSRKLEDRIV